MFQRGKIIIVSEEDICQKDDNTNKHNDHAQIFGLTPQNNEEHHKYDVETSNYETGLLVG